MNTSNRYPGYLVYLALVVSLLLSAWTMPVAAQLATPIVEEQSQDIPDSDSESSSENSKAGTNDNVITPGTPTSSKIQDPPSQIANDDGWWLVLSPIQGPIKPGYAYEYYMDITNPYAYTTNYYITMTTSVGATVVIPETFDNTYACFPVPGGYMCDPNYQVGAFNTRAFWFDIAIDSENTPNICTTAITIDIRVAFSTTYTEDFSQTLTPTCGEPAEISTSAIFRNQSGQDIASPAQVGDSVGFKTSVTNPGTVHTLTVDSFKQTIDPALMPLGWRVEPASAVAPDGPCDLVSGILTCSSVVLAPEETFTIELVSDPIPDDTNACGNFTSFASIPGGATSNTAGVTIECPPRIAEYPTINLGDYTCSGYAPITLTSGKYLDTIRVLQLNRVVSRVVDGTYPLKSSIETSIEFTIIDSAIWPSELPILYEGGSWHEDDESMIFRFTPAGRECSPQVQITQTLLDANGIPIAGELNLAPGADFSIRVEVTNTGKSRIREIMYESVLPSSLWMVTGHMRPGFVPYTGIQICTAIFAEVSTKGVPGTVHQGARCITHGLQPGSSASFIIQGKTPTNPTADQCANGIATTSEITFVHTSPIAIPSEALNISINCASPQSRQMVRINTSNQESLEGAPWKLHATTASQQNLPTYDQGTVGANNLITFNRETPPGMYRLVIEPTGSQVIDLVLTIDGTQPEIVLQVDVDSVEETPTETPSPTSIPTETPSPTSSATETPSRTASATVTPTTTSTVAPITPTHTSEAPTMTPAPQEPDSSGNVVTGLPATGVPGDSGSGQSLVMSLAIASLFIIAFGFMRRNSLK